MQLTGSKPAAAAKPAPSPSPSPSEGAAGGTGHVMMGAEYPPHNRRLKNIQMVKYNFEDDLYDEYYYYGAQDMYYPNHGYHPGMTHMSLPPPHCSNYLPPPPPLPHRHFSHAPPPWQRFPPAPAPAPWGQHRYFGHPRPHFGRPFVPPMGHPYYGAY